MEGAKKTARPARGLKTPPLSNRPPATLYPSASGCIIISRWINRDPPELEMVYKKSWAIGTILLATVLLIGCGGGGTKVESSNTTTTTTMGQELMDLNESYEKGIITEKEYETAKKQIMKRYK